MEFLLLLLLCLTLGLVVLCAVGVVYIIIVLSRLAVPFHIIEEGVQVRTDLS